MSRALFGHPDLASPDVDDSPLGDCDRCNGDLYAVAYLEPINAEVVCPACAKKLAVGALTDWPEDELDGFPAVERARTCSECNRYECRCL